MGENKSLESHSRTVGCGASTPFVSQGLCLAARHAAALATDVYCTGFPGTGGKSK